MNSKGLVDWEIYWQIGAVFAVMQVVVLKIELSPKAKLPIY